MKFSIKDFFSKCDQIYRKLRIWSRLLKKSLIEHFIIFTVSPVFLVNSKAMFCPGKNIFFSKFFMVIFKIPVMLCSSLIMPKSLKYWQLYLYKQRQHQESTLELCNTRRVPASSWLQPLISSFPAGKIKYSSSPEAIIKAVDLGRISEVSSSTHCFIISIIWSLYSLSFKSSFQLLPCGTFCWT